MNALHSPQPSSLDQMSPRLAYRIEDAASALGVGRTLMYRLIRDGQLKVVKIGSRSLISASELNAFLARGGGK